MKQLMTDTNIIPILCEVLASSANAQVLTYPTAQSIITVCN